MKKFKNFLNEKNYPYYDDDKGKTWLNEVEWRWGDIT